MLKLIALMLAAAAPLPVLTGRWSGKLKLQTPDGQTREGDIYLTLRQEGSSISGTAGGRSEGNVPIDKAVLDGKLLSFQIAASQGQIAKFRLERTGDNTMAGTCAFEGGPQGVSGTVEIRRTSNDPATPASASPKPYDDVRVISGARMPKDLGQVDEALLRTLTFNEKTRWPKPSPLPAQLLQEARDPGLGIRELHSQGITGKGVSVAIIDQPLLPDHPEYAGRIAEYRDFGCKSETSMHGPAVASLLTGKSIGTAPDARLYYAAAPRWLRDAANEAKALDWIVERNGSLPAAERIRVVSVSASPGMKGEKNSEAWDEAFRRAEAAGILVLDCSEERGIIGPCWLQGGDHNDAASCAPGFPGMAPFFSPKRLLAPSSPRTSAEQWARGEYGYVYWGRGGQSWTVPYAAGVLALGWQVQPALGAKEAVDLLFRCAYKSPGGALIIQPRQFVRMVREYRR